MNELVFKELNLNLDIKVCTIGGEEINLTRNEFNLLEFLIKNKNKIHSRQEILNNVWDSKVSLRTVDTTMSRLRKKMKNLGKYLVTNIERPIEIPPCGSSAIPKYLVTLGSALPNLPPAQTPLILPMPLANT